MPTDDAGCMNHCTGRVLGGKHKLVGFLKRARYMCGGGLARRVGWET